MAEYKDDESKAGDCRVNILRILPEKMKTILQLVAGLKTVVDG